MLFPSMGRHTDTELVGGTVVVFAICEAIAIVVEAIPARFRRSAIFGAGVAVFMCIADGVTAERLELARCGAAVAALPADL